MTKQTKIVLGLTLAVFLLLGAAVVAFKRGGSHPARDSFFVKQRIINLQKGNQK